MVMPQLPDFPLKDSFCCGAESSSFGYYPELKEKEIFFAFKPNDTEKDMWSKYGFTKLRHLLSFLEKKYGGLENFEVLFFRRTCSKPFYVTTENGKNWIKINLDSYTKYGSEIDSAIKHLQLDKYAKKIWGDFSKRVPKNFFSGKPQTSLVEELENSYYNLLESLIKEIDKMSDIEKKNLKKALEHSSLGTELIKEYKKLKPDAPKIQLKTFLEVIEKLGEDDVGELFDAIIHSKISEYFIKHLLKLPRKEQNKIFKNLPEMSKMLDRYKKLQKSLRKFEKEIETHRKASKKDEKAIHKLLIKHYWLLGIEYFDKKILSDYTADGKLTKDTKIGNRKHADFIIKRIDGLDTCVLIELEEANDRIFNNDNTISKEVYDGISQAVDYYIEYSSQGYNSKGMAVIGTISGTRLNKEQKQKLSLLKESFHNVEILTYDDIIQKARNTLNFWRSYEPEE